MAARPMLTPVSHVSIADILPYSEGDMARRTYQMPNVHKRVDCKRPYWEITYRVSTLKAGKQIARPQRKKFLGYAAGPDSITKREAERRRDEFMRTINQTSYVVQSQIPLTEFLKAYDRVHVSQLASSTQAKYTVHMKNHVLPEFSTARLMDITTERIEQWLAAKKLGHATKLDLKNILSGIFTVASRWGYWRDQNPAQVAILRGSSVPAREKCKIADADIVRLLAELPPDVRLIIEMALYTTLRISEVLGLMWKHIDWIRGVVMVRQRFYRGNLDVPKNRNASRDVPLGDLVEKLKVIYPGAGNDERFVFSVKTRWGVCRDDRGINQHFLRPAAKRVGIYRKGFGFHQFRREAITALGAIDPMQAMKMAGHSKADMTLAYTLSDEGRQRKAVEQFQGRMRVN